MSCVLSQWVGSPWRSIAGPFRRTVPLRIRQAPAAPERLVELDIGEEPIAPDLRQRPLRRVKLLLGLEHLEVVCEPVAGSPCRTARSGSASGRPPPWRRRCAHWRRRAAPPPGGDRAVARGGSTATRPAPWAPPPARTSASRAEPALGSCPAGC